MMGFVEPLAAMLLFDRLVLSLSFAYFLKHPTKIAPPSPSHARNPYMPLELPPSPINVTIHFLLLLTFCRFHHLPESVFRSRVVHLQDNDALAW